MVNIIMVQFLVLIFSLGLYAKVDRIHSESYLGEKKLESYSERYQPIIFHDIYQGKVTFQDEIYFQNFFQNYLFQKEQDYTFFLSSELKGGLVCTNESLSEYFDDIRFSYRLITLSYLLESQWHMKMVSDHFRLKNGCDFDLKSWVNTCVPKSKEMKTFVSRLKQFLPRYDENLPSDYKKNDWWQEFKNHKFKSYSHYRLESECRENCKEEKLHTSFNNICETDKQIMSLICSEQDEIYGLSSNRDAYYLIGLSNIINTFNKKGEALGCLRRFSEIMAHKEVRYDVLKQLFPSLQTFLRQKYQERFLQGRVFFYGSGKEFEDKGLFDLYVKEQPLKIEKGLDSSTNVPKPSVVTIADKSIIKVKAPEVQTIKAEPFKEIRKPIKSAFLQASELRLAEDLDRVEVDMLNLKYDYVFSLNMINTLSERLKTFMTRDALVEMMNYDKLGTKSGPVPLIFLKYMIDLQEHHGLWNMISVLGDKFYVSNEIDAAFNPGIQFVHLVNNQSSGNQWQLFILKP